MSDEMQPILEGDEEEMVEIDWEPLQGAIDAFHHSGLDFTDARGLLDHWGALLGALLRKVQKDNDLAEEEVAELAAECAAFGVDLAFGDDELPEFVPSDEQQEN